MTPTSEVSTPVYYNTMNVRIDRWLHGNSMCNALKLCTKAKILNNNKVANLLLQLVVKVLLLSHQSVLQACFLLIDLLNRFLSGRSVAAKDTARIALLLLISFASCSLSTPLPVPPAGPARQ